MKRGVAIIGKVGVAEMLRVILDDSLEQYKIIEVNSAADFGGNIDPGVIV